MVVATHDNATYTLRELDGTVLRLFIASKQIKAFKKKEGRFHSDDIAAFESQEEVEDTKLEISEDENLHKDEEECYFTHTIGCVGLEGCMLCCKLF